MATERRNPLPPGRYWIDAFGSKRDDFRVWLDKHEAEVHVEQTKEYLDPSGAWYLFSVSAPVQWEGPGFPTIADENVHSQEDTGEKGPPEKSGVEKIEETIESASSFLTLAALGVIGFVAYKILK